MKKTETSKPVKTPAVRKPKGEEKPPKDGKAKTGISREKTPTKAPKKTGTKRKLSIKLPSRKAKNAASAQGVPASPGMAVLNFVVLILDWSKAKVISEILEEAHVRFHFICKGRGTASSEILDLLGIGSSEKAVVMCLEQNIMVPVLLKRISKSQGLHNPGAGIAFTVPLSGINKPMLQVFKESIHKNISEEEKKEKVMKEQKKHDLVIIVANQGYSDELMSCARDAGATGGTIINARGQAHRGPVKFFGISVQDEKEVILILTSRNSRVPIMQAVSQNFGIASKAQGIVFSLPAENITGLDI